MDGHLALLVTVWDVTGNVSSAFQVPATKDARLTIACAANGHPRIYTLKPALQNEQRCLHYPGLLSRFRVVTSFASRHLLH